MTECWNTILTSLSAVVEPADYKVWLSPLTAEIAERRLELSMKGASSFMLRRLEQKFGGAIRRAAAAQLGCEAREVELVFSAPPAEAAPRAPKARAAEAGAVLSRPAVDAPRAQPLSLLPVRDVPESRSSAPRSLVAGLGLDQPLTPSGSRLNESQWRYSFDGFVVGPTNAMAMTAAQDLCRPSSYVETLFVSSDSGLGKTHIVQSAVRQIMEDRGPQARVAYLTADDFYARFRMGLRSDSLEDFTDRVRALDFLLLDDVQYLHGKAKTQELLHSLVKHLQNRGSRVVIASRLMPRELKALDPQLVSLISSGVLADIEAPTYEMRLEIVRRKAQALGLSLSDEVAAMVAGALEGDVRRVVSCLQTLRLKTELLGSGPTPELVSQLLSQIARPARDRRSLPSYETLMGLVIQCFGLTETQLCSRLRRQKLVDARNLLFYLARKHTEMTLAQIGAKVNRKHSTVIKGIATVEQSLSSETATGRRTARFVDLIEKNAGLAAAD